MKKLPKIWTCKDNPNKERNNCDVEEDTAVNIESILGMTTRIQGQEESSKLLETFCALANTEEDIDVECYHIDILSAEEKETSRIKEVDNILEYNCLTPDYAENFNELEISKRLNMKIFAKKKRGIDEKVKSRAPVGAGGRPQDKQDVKDNYSPTAKNSNIMIGLKVALIENREISSLDIKSAYLNADMKTSTTIEGTNFRRILELKGDLLNTFLQRKPEWEKFVCKGLGAKERHKGSLFLVINKAMYGLLEAGLLWYDELCNTMTELLYHKSYSDPCVWHNDAKSSVIIYVDDLLLLCKT